MIYLFFLTIKHFITNHMTSHSTKNFITKRFIKVGLGLFIVTTLSACDNAQPTQSAQLSSITANKASVGIDERFVGCYAFNKTDYAVLKISYDNGFFMQMKNNDKHNIWDNKEPMTISSNNSQFFGTNALNLDPKDVQQIIVRTDEIMAIGQVDDSLVALNPALDSQFVVNLAGAVNTIYSVVCDDVPMNLLDK